MKAHETLIGIFAAGLLAFSAGCNSSDDTTTPPSETSAKKVTQLAPEAGDLVAHQLVRTAGLENAVNLEKKTIVSSWAIDGESKIDARPTPHVAKSREFRMITSVADLRGGITLPVTAPGAVVKISPEGATDANTFSAKDFVLRDSTGTNFTDGKGVKLAVSAEQLREVGVAFAPGTAAFTLGAELAPGPVTLKLNEASELPEGDSVLVHVLEKASTTLLSVQTREASYLNGQRLEFGVQWLRPGMTPTDSDLTAAVYSPSGKHTVVKLQSDGKGGFLGALDLNDPEARPGELWEVEVDGNAKVEGGQVVRRTVKTAFSYSAATAKLAGKTELLKSGDGEDLSLSVGVEVGSPGRYAITGVVYGTDSSGNLQPFAMAQSARFLEPGQATIELTVQQKLVSESGLSAPFEVRDLLLQDQSRMGTLHRQARALKVDP